MTTSQALEQGNSLLQEWAVETRRIEPNRLDVVIDAGKMTAAVQTLVRAHWGYLVAITGLDLGPATGQFQVLYHFAESAAVLSLRVPISRVEAVVPSIGGIIPAAIVFERELAEMFGIHVGDSSEREHLFLPEDWPNGQYPLRKDWTTGKLRAGAFREN